MNHSLPVNASLTKTSDKEQLKQQIAQYLAQQPATALTLHRWMKALEIAGLCISAAIFALAMFLSIRWETVPGTVIATAWIALPTSFSLITVLCGLHTLLLRAASLAVMPGKSQQFVTGRQANGQGWAMVATGLVSGAFLGVLAYGAWTYNLAILTPMITVMGVALGVGMAASIIVKMVHTTVQKLSKPR